MFNFYYVSQKIIITKSQLITAQTITPQIIIEQTASNNDFFRSKNSFSPITKRDHLPIITKSHPKYEKMRYQHNLNAIIMKINNNMECTNKVPFYLSTTEASSNIGEIRKGDFRITTINLSTDRSNKNSLTRSYVEATERRLADEKKKRIQRFQRFTFQPWIAHQEESY